MWNRCVVDWLEHLRFDVQVYDEVAAREKMHVNGPLELRFGEVCRVSVTFNSVENLAILPVVYECLDPDDLSEDVAMWKKRLRYSYCAEEEHFFETEDLIKDCENEPKTAENAKKPSSFPPPEEEEVPVMRNRSIRVERPKTLGSTLTKKQDEPIKLDLKGVTRLEIDNEICYKVPKRQFLRFFDKRLQLVDETGSYKIVREPVFLRKGLKVISKKELEMIEKNGTVFRLHFDSTKDCKFFQELEKSYHLPASSGMKNVAPWWQLRKLLKKRSSRDILESKGIIRNEPIFGNTLEELCDAEHPVPEVITKIVRLIEQPKNIESLGIYRASPNLAVLQHIRCEIDLGKWDVLEHHKDDVDVLTGALKLFFRELKEPLVSHEIQRELHKIIKSGTADDEIPRIVDRLPPPNRSTFIFLIKHLLKVCQHKEKNKMDFHNIAICWTPSMFTLFDSGPDIVLLMAEFTKITEDLLNYYDKLSVKDNPVPEKPVGKQPDFVHEVIRKLTEIIEVHIDVEGIYRKSGSSSKIDKLMKSLEKHSLLELEPGRNDIHDLCCVLKKYVASLRSTIVPDEFFHRYLEICDTVADSSLTAEVRRMVDELPRKDVVYLIFDHLYEVVQHEHRNKLSFSVLSDIWMTTLMATADALNYKKNMPKYSKLFLIFMNLNDSHSSNLDATKRRFMSRYDNVPDDIQCDNETLQNVTKL